MMKRFAGLLAGAALVGGLALAQQDSPPATGGSGQTQEQKSSTTPPMMPGQATGQTDVKAEGNQLIGTVVKSKSHTLYLQHMGAVLPIRVEKETDLSALAGKKLTDLKEGDEVKVSFQIKNQIDNVATRIEQPTATGGSACENGRFCPIYSIRCHM